MISREPTIERLATARRLLLEPFGLDETHLSRALAEITAHQVDDADLYFQYTRSEGWSLEEGIVKTGSFSIDQGVGVRAVSGEKTAFAYSDDISEASLLDAARTVRTISAAARHRPGQGAAPRRSRAGVRSTTGLDPIATLDSTAKVQLLERVGKAGALQGSARGAGHGRAGERIRRGAWWRAPTARWPPTCGRWCGCRSP